MTLDKPKKPRISYKDMPKPEISDAMESFIQENDKIWFLRRYKIASIKVEMHDLLAKMNRPNLRCILWHYCSVYGKIRLKPVSVSTVLTESQWETLKTEMHELQKYHDFSDLSLNEVVVLVRTKVSTNREQLIGLPKRLKTWKKTKGV